MKIVLLASAVAAIGFALPAHAQRDAILGEIRLFGSDFCPEGWVEADGRLMPIRSNPALYSLFSDSYGGDHVTTFGLPDLRKAIPVAAKDKEKRLRYCVAISGDFPRRP